MNELLIARANRLFKPLNDIAVTDGMLRVLVHTPESVQEGFWARDNEAGNVCLFGHDRYPRKVIEYVAGSKEDSVTTLYEATSIFDSKTDLMRIRKDLIREIKAMTMTVNNSFALYDEGRERHVKLKEMGTAQLIDTVIKMQGASR